DDFPFLLGHESAGVVSEVGEGVTSVEVGDFVILNWRAICGDCRACKRGEPWYCFDTHNASQKMTLTDGTELEPALGIGSFAEKTLVAEGQCTKVREADPAVVGLLGCGVMAGIGAAINTGEVTRGKTVAVDEKNLDCSKDLGATDVVNTKGMSEDEVVSAIQERTGGFGADVVVDAVGRPETWRQAFYGRDLAGTVVLVGVPTPEMELT